MSADRNDILRAGYEAFNSHDWGGIFRSAAPDFELVTAGRVLSPGTYRGVDEAKRQLEDLFEPFEEVSVEPEKFLEADGDRIVALVIMRFRPRDSTASVENRIAHVYTFRDEAITRMQIFPEREAALAATGLSAESSTRDR